LADDCGDEFLRFFGFVSQAPLNFATFGQIFTPFVAPIALLAIELNPLGDMVLLHARDRCVINHPAPIFLRSDFSQENHGLSKFFFAMLETCRKRAYHVCFAAEFVRVKISSHVTTFRALGHCGWKGSVNFGFALIRFSVVRGRGCRRESG